MNILLFYFALAALSVKIHHMCRHAAGFFSKHGCALWQKCHIFAIAPRRFFQKLKFIYFKLLVRSVALVLHFKITCTVQADLQHQTES